jgi:hypothetical protein
MLGALAPMGFSPTDARAWSFWEYNAVIAGWNDAHAAPEDDKPQAPSIDTLRAAKARARAEREREAQRDAA